MFGTECNLARKSPVHNSQHWVGYMKDKETDILNEYLDEWLKNRHSDAANQGQKRQNRGFEIDGILDMEKRQLLCMIALIELVHQRTLKLINVVVGATLVTWVIIALGFIITG